MNTSRRNAPQFQRSTTSHAVLIALSSLVLVTSSVHAAGDTVTVSNQTIDGKQSNGYFVQTGNLMISNSLLANFITTGGVGSGGGAGMGGAIFVNDGASVVLDNVRFSGNTAVGGKGGVGSVGGSLNGRFSPEIKPMLNGEGGITPDHDSSMDVGGTTGSKGGSGLSAGLLPFTDGTGGAGGKGGNGTDGGDRNQFLITAAADATINAAAAAAAVIAADPLKGPADHAEAISSAAAAAFALATATAELVLWDKALAAGQVGGGGGGGQGGNGGESSFGFGGNVGGNGGNGGKGGSNWGGSAYSGGASGGDAGDGGTGGAGGFGAGGGSGGKGGSGGERGVSERRNGLEGGGGEGGDGGFGAGNGSSGDGRDGVTGGNGGSGLGGSIFVRDGGSLTIKGNTTFNRGKVRGGTGDFANKGESGNAAGTDLFMMKGSNVVLDAGAGKTITFNGTIADDSSASIDSYGNAEGNGADLTIKSGLVVFNGENTYTGQTILAGGALRAVDGVTLHGSSNINFASNRDGGVLLVNTGVFDRYTGTSGERVQWTGSGGFAAEEQDLSVNLSGGLERTWGVEGFVGGNNALILGTADSTHKVTLENDINLNGQSGTVLVKANAANDNYGILNGVLRNGSLSVGDANHTGVLIMTKANTYDAGTFVNGGELRLVEDGALSATGKVEVNNGATLDTSSTGDQAIGTLAGNGAIKLGKNTLTLNQNADTTFAGNIQDGGVAGGTGSGIVKNGSNTLTITGQNDYTGKTQINAGQIVLNGSLSTDTVNIVAGAVLTNNSGGLEADVALRNDGLINQNHDDTVASLVNTGTINGSKTLTAKTYDLNNGSLINANLGSGTLTANGTVQLNGTSAAETVRIQKNSITILGSAERLLDSSDVSVDGKLVLNGDETVGSFSSTGTLDNVGRTLHAKTYNLNNGSVINANLGAGSVTANGSVLLNGTSQAATVTIASGTTTLGAPERLLNSSDVTVNGKLIMGGAETIGTLAGNQHGVLELSGAKLTLNQNKNTTYAGVIQDSSLPNSGSLQKDGSGKLTLSGASTYTGNTQINSGTLTLEGSLQSQNIAVAQAATLDNQHGGLSATAALNNSGTINQNANDTVKTLINSGSINGSGTLSADSYTLNNGAVINANLGAGTLETHGNVTLNGTSQAGTVRVYQASVLTLNGENRLYTAADARVDGKLILGGGDQTLRSLIGSGLVDVTAYKLKVTQGGAFSGSINAGNTDLDVNGTKLDLTQGTTTTKSTTVANGTTLSVSQNGKLDSDTTTVSQGGTLKLDNSNSIAYKTLTGNGTVQTASGGFENKSGSTVKGFLTFTGNYTNNGTLAPGNSPGMTTINGDFTNNGTFEAELQNTTAVTGYDQTRVGGNVTLNSGSALVVQTYGGTTPARGNSYQIIADLSGNAKAVTGTFGSVKFDIDGLAGSGAPVSNAAVVFDVASGQLLATGQNGASSTFADMGNSSSQRAAAAALLKVATADVGQNQINSASTVGKLAAQFITANGSGATANAERFTPEYYGAMADNALRTGELVSGMLLQRHIGTLDKTTPPGQSNAFAGYIHDQMNTADKADLSRRDFYVGGEYRIADAVTIGTVLLDGNGDLGARFGSGSSKVRAASLFARLSVNPSLDVLASVNHSSYDYQLSRNTVAGQTSANTGAKALSSSLAAVYNAQITPQLAILPRVGISHGKASVDSLLEQGKATDRLDLSGFDAQQTKAQLGATWLWSSLDQGKRWNVAFDLGLEHSFSDRKDNMRATLVSDRRVGFPITFSDERKTLVNFGVSANYGFSKNLSVSASLEGRSNVDGQSGKLGVNYTF